MEQNDHFDVMTVSETSSAKGYKRNYFYEDERKFYEYKKFHDPKKIEKNMDKYIKKCSANFQSTAKLKVSEDE